jgi:hypothetical protein
MIEVKSCGVESSSQQSTSLIEAQLMNAGAKPISRTKEPLTICIITTKEELDKTEYLSN